jgi:predicted dienelactone hydrolase
MRSGIALALVAGVATAAVAARVDPSAEQGFPVGVTTLALADAGRGVTLATEVWYPARTEGRDAPLGRGRFPLVLLAHGFCGFRTNYEYLAVHLARHGFLVAAPDFPAFTKATCDDGVPFAGNDDPPADLSYLRAALRDRAGPAGAFARAIRGRRAGLVGHSFGGLMVVRAATADRAFVAVVALAPAAGPLEAARLAGVLPRRAVLAMGGTADTLVPVDRATAPLYEALAPPAFLLRLVGGTHGGFSDVDAGLAPEALARQQALVRRYATAFLARYLARDRRFVRFLTAEDAAAQGADVELRASPR